MAIENNLEIIPVLNKIDLPSADVDKVSEEIVSLLGCKKDDILAVSAKTGLNVESVLDAIVERIPEPRKLSKKSTILDHHSSENDTESIKALIFDSQYDTYKGVVIYVKLFSGQIQK